MQLRHIGLVTNELEKSIAFYTKWFACSIARAMDESGDFISKILSNEKSINDDVRVKTVKLNFPSGQSQLELLQFETPDIAFRDLSLFMQGLTHFAITVPNIDDLYENMSEEGVSFISPPQLSDDEKAKVCFCKDPNDVYIELVEIIS